VQAPGGARAPVPQLVTHGGFTILKPDTHWRQSRKDVRRLGDKNYSLSTKSTELNMFNFGDNVDRDTVDKVERAGDSRLSANRRQTGDKSPVHTLATKSNAEATFMPATLANTFLFIL